MARRRRVPDVLWKAYRNRARTLADTIISLIPPSPPPPGSDCRCNGRRCLGCSGGDAMSFLLRPNDPADYRKLLSQCFVVVSEDAPPITVFNPQRRWSQHEIVRRTIEMIMREKLESPNVICIGYDKHSHSSPIVELLTCASWGLLLRRVGDAVMFHLLKNTSVFLPVPRKKHHQVAGSSISNLFFKFSKDGSESKYQHPSFVLGFGRKRKRVDEVDSISEREHFSCSFDVHVPSSSINCFGCTGQSYSNQISGHCRKKHCQKNLSEEAIRTGDANNEVDQKLKQHGSSNQITGKPKKRERQYSWQRNRKRRQLNSQETYSLIPCTKNLNNNDSLAGRLQNGFKTSLTLQTKKMPLQCSCCLMLQTLRRVTKGAEINGRSLFYMSESSSSVFPRIHLLNSLRLDFSGANVLFNDIFCLSSADVSAWPMQCAHSSNCLINSTCLYHSIIKSLKILIRKARYGKHLKLLDRHCATPSQDQNASGHVGSIFEGNESVRKSLENGQYGVHLEGKLPFENLHGFDSTICDGTPEMTDHQFNPSKSYCQKKQVVSFIWAVCRSIVPPDMLGTSSNWRILRKNIFRFISLRRFEKFSVKQCMHKLKTSRFPFLSNKHSSCCLSDHVLNNGKGGCSKVNDDMHAVKRKILESWILWFFSCLVVPLVRANFYVTESEHGKQDAFYYRKSIWEKLMNRVVTCFKKQSYHLLNNEYVRKVIRNRSFGFSRVRLLPKGNEVRALANLKAASRIPAKGSSFNVRSFGLKRKDPFYKKNTIYEYFKSVNGVLHDLHAVLKGLQMKEPGKLGSSVFNYNDVYRKLCPFFSVLKSGSNTVPSVFFVVADVSKAFDSVNQDKLLSVMKNVIPNGQYLLKKSHHVVCGKKSLWVQQKLISMNQDTSAGSTNFTNSSCSSSLHCVIVDQEWSRITRKEELYFKLYQHVKHNVLQLDRKFFLQDVGISQGSILSSLLCSFYLGHLEKNLIFPLLGKASEPATEDLSVRESNSDAFGRSEDEIISLSSKSLLLRFIDDFLFVSTSREQASQFLSRLQGGFSEYNCYMNEKKFGLNFDIGQMSGLTSNRVCVGEDDVSFLQWSGLLINCCTLEVQADYTRYLNTHLRSTLTVCWQGKPGRCLKAKLCDYLRPKCHPIFYDSNINSAGVVRLNIYQAFLLCAMKFHCYVCDLSNTCRLSVKTYVQYIEKSIRYMHKLIKRRMHSVKIDSNFHPILQVEKEEIVWLGFFAYIRVLKRKQSRHKELLSFLQSILRAHEKGKGESSALQYAINDSHSSLLWKIKY
ncbi:telomerase reverse transcriptase [Cornus florida]|uniref:telomerase reverse transcriptase n=1 Tax=Cornus florida TaxID=4283 RepID=UPI00289CC8BD|nr:telomerase reverse transcriptase [Cornus florida]